MSRKHHYKALVTWTGNRGEGTTGYTSYDRNYTVQIDGKPDLKGSADTAFRGDASKYNPEDLFLISLSSCHMLWYLHLCADAGIVVSDYKDNPAGTMTEDPNGGHFTSVVLHPEVIITDASRIDEANELHREAHKQCFIANSCNFPVTHEANCSAVKP
ncbi:OsmC family protein [Fluviicola sp.]|uniref:OsmC family protein n=1 Tax=Fluviicola sp. TaxID=1917219 RepID=UPI0031D0730B